MGEGDLGVESLLGFALMRSRVFGMAERLGEHIVTIVLSWRKLLYVLGRMVSVIERL